MIDLNKMYKAPWFVQMGDCNRIGAICSPSGVVSMLGVIVNLETTNIQVMLLAPYLVEFYLRNEDRIQHFETCPVCREAQRSANVTCTEYASFCTVVDDLRRTIFGKIAVDSLPIGVPGDNPLSTENASVNETAFSSMELSWEGDDKHARFESELTGDTFEIVETDSDKFLIRYQNPLDADWEDNCSQEERPSMAEAKAYAADEYMEILSVSVQSFREEMARIRVIRTPGVEAKTGGATCQK